MLQYTINNDLENMSDNKSYQLGSDDLQKKKFSQNME